LDVVQKFGRNNLEPVIEHEEYLEDGKVFLYSRSGIFYARVYKGEGTRKYIHRSLKTRNLADARKKAIKFHYEIEFRKEEALPLQQKSFGDVIAEYIRLREAQHVRGTTVTINNSSKQETSIYMLRQIKRVSKFWIEYCGKKAVDKIDNAILQDYVPWRKDFYHNKPVEDWPKNARPNPKDKTLEWEVIFAKTVIKFAHERGYRGKIALPDWRFKSKGHIVRPAVAQTDLAQLLMYMRNWVKTSEQDALKTYQKILDGKKVSDRQYNRQLLKNYVMILAHSGMRVGEANNLLDADVIEFHDQLGRKNYMFNVKGKTGSRTVVPLANVVPYVEAIKASNTLHEQTKDMYFVRGRRKESNKASWFFRMADGNKIISLIDMFQELMRRIGKEKNREGQKFTLYGLRHQYAVRMINKGVPIWDIAKNMGTSVQNIERYYGRSATPATLATSLGG
jgi:integrase